eukprot:CAMPEP_0183745672 /NCGR_PEP_ID=MMETSP0737-20130205/66365_1 /TAXON_ID=385413 /ORGANISM="Thalassiosira miniscula, Strain CCMP1093" /LENGTH=599 /DNA_ID=CAMNT_0025981351 /DNA_START=9 /DNA_END=1809 /DNA_ORIENTATION=-
MKEETKESPHGSNNGEEEAQEWSCCGEILPAHRKRCAKCYKWRGGKREMVNMKKNGSDDNGEEEGEGWSCCGEILPARRRRCAKCYKWRGGKRENSAEKEPTNTAFGGIIHAAAAAPAPAAAVSEAASPRSKRKRQKTSAEKEEEEEVPNPRRWRCDICRNAYFETFGEATAHERICAKQKKVEHDDEDELFGDHGVLTIEATTFIEKAFQQRDMEEHPFEEHEIAFIKYLILDENNTLRECVTDILEAGTSLEEHEIAFIKYLILDENNTLRECVTDILEAALKSRDLEKTPFKENELKLAGQLTYMEFKRQEEPFEKIKLPSFPRNKPFEIVQIPTTRAPRSDDASSLNRTNRRKRMLATRHMNHLPPCFVREYRKEMKQSFFEKYPERKKEKKDKRLCRAKGCLKRNKRFDGYCKPHFMEIVGDLERVKELQRMRHCKVEGCSKYKVHRCNQMCLSCFRKHGGLQEHGDQGATNSGSEEEEEDEEEEEEEEDEEEETIPNNMATATSMGAGDGGQTEQTTLEQNTIQQSTIQNTIQNTLQQQTALQNALQQQHPQFAIGYGDGGNVFQTNLYSSQHQNDPMAEALGRWSGLQGGWG